MDVQLLMGIISRLLSKKYGKEIRLKVLTGQKDN
jgi:hypothetical protein